MITTSMKVYDDFLPNDLQQDIANALLSDTFPWYFHFSTINDISNVLPENVIDTHQFYHNAYNKTFNTSSTYLALFRKALYYFEEKSSKQVDDILRIKANLITPYPNWHENNYHPPHHDMPNDHSVSLLYYPINSDGPTYFFDKKWSDENKDLKIVDKVTPKANRAVLFPSGQYHTSSCPIKSSKRIVVNYILDVS